MIAKDDLNHAVECAEIAEEQARKARLST
jgi:hypothetical protein